MTPIYRPASASGPKRPGCTRCRRARWVAAAVGVFALAAGLTWHADLARGAAPVPAMPAAEPASAVETALPAIAGAPPAPVTRAAAGRSVAPLSPAVGGSAKTGPDTPPTHADPVATAPSSPESVLLLRTVGLRPGRRGELYRPLQLVREPALTYAVLVDGQLPPGLVLGEDGLLRGTPTTLGLFLFRLAVIDAETGRRLTQQPYALRVALPVHGSPVPASAASTAPTLRTLSAADAEAPVDLQRETPISYKLTAADFAAVVPTEEASPAPAVAAPAALPPAAAASDVDAMQDVPEVSVLPTVDQLKALLTPLLEVEYPTRPLFDKALQNSHCTYYRAHLREQASRRRLKVDLACPPAPTDGTGAKPRPSASGDPMTLAAFYAALLPPEIEAQVVMLAEKHHPIEQAVPLAITGGGCGCHVSESGENTYGLFPYWLATDAKQTVDFSLFNRIGFLGAMLKDDGTFAVPAGWTGDSGGFGRAASRHGTALDLVIYRRDWRSLLRQTDAQLEDFARVSARNAVLMTEARHEDITARWLQPLLVPAWRERALVYSGLTIFFDLSSTDPAQAKAFKRFYLSFMQRVVTEMQAVGRPYDLNVVVPESDLGDEDSAYGFQQLSEYMEMAQKRPRDANVDAETLARYHGKSDIRVFYLVAMGDPSATTKIDLRQKIDKTSVLGGHRRVAFLWGVVPMLFGARSDKPISMTPENMQHSSDDLAYMRWNFGGVALWPTPVVGLGSGTPLRNLLAKTYHPPLGVTDGVCELACPNRLVLRLLMQLALALDALALAAYSWSCRVRRAGGRRLLLGLWLIGAATLALGGVIFSCDPFLSELRADNTVLYVLIGVLCAGGIWLTFKPRTEEP